MTLFDFWLSVLNSNLKIRLTPSELIGVVRSLGWSDPSSSFFIKSLKNPQYFRNGLPPLLNLHEINCCWYPHLGSYELHAAGYHRYLGAETYDFSRMTHPVLDVHGLDLINTNDFTAYMTSNIQQPASSPRWSIRNSNLQLHQKLKKKGFIEWDFTLPGENPGLTFKHSCELSKPRRSFSVITPQDLSFWDIQMRKHKEDFHFLLPDDCIRFPDQSLLGSKALEIQEDSMKYFLDVIKVIDFSDEGMLSFFIDLFDPHHQIFNIYHLLKHNHDLISPSTQDYWHPKFQLKPSRFMLQCGVPDLYLQGAQNFSNNILLKKEIGIHYSIGL